MAELYFRSDKAVLENTLSNHQALGSGIPGEALLFVEKSLPSVQWYAVSVRPRHEKLVAPHLEHQGLDPLLRYVLRVLRAPGPVQSVTSQAQPAVIPDSEIRALESSLSAGLRLQPHPYLHQGARVRLKRGPLVGAEGIMIRRKERFRLVLSIDLIMRSVVFEVDEADVEPI